MGDAWGGYANGKIPTSAMYPVQGKYMKPEAAHALIAAIQEAARHKIAVSVTEAYRPLGIPADQNIRDDRYTSTRSSNQWFQYGRMKRGETPAAAYPGSSAHGFGLAADIQPTKTSANGGLLQAIMKTHGFLFNVPSESWHVYFVGIPKPNPEPSKLQKLTWKGMQTYLRDYWGYTLPIDGIAGRGTWESTQKWLAAHWLYKGKIDGIPGVQTYAAMNRAGCKLR